MSEDGKQEHELTEKDKESRNWIDCTTYEEAARGERWYLRGYAYGGWEVTILTSPIKKVDD